MKKEIKPIVQPPVKIPNPEGDDEAGFLLNAVKLANGAYTYAKENHANAEYSLGFIFGDQYTDYELKEKAEMNRLALTFNKLPQFVNKVTGAQRSTVHTIKISAATSSLAGDSEKIETMNGEKMEASDAISDMVREIEYISNARAWYKMAFRHALEGGFGFIRVLTEYQEDSFDLDIKIKGIRDRWSVLTDPYCQEPDMSDMNYCFINESMTKREFEKRYPGKSYEAMPGSQSLETSGYWETEDMVTVSEYFRREPYKKTLALGSDGNTYVWDDIKDETTLVEMAAQGIEITDFREQDAYKVIWCKISQGSILEPDIDFPTTTIPIIPVLGRQYDFRDKRRFRGLIDDAIDAQIAQNKMKSSSVERIDSSPINPFVCTDKAIEGYEDQWAEANSVKYSTLVYKKGEDRPTREMGATMPTAELQTATVLDEDMKASIGIFNASLGATSNEISGKAIQERQQEADVGTYEFLDNYNDAIRRTGLLVVELIPSIYDTRRVVTMRNAEGDSDSVDLNRPNIAEDGTSQSPNKIKKARRVVEVTSGKSYETQAKENASQILELMKVAPQVAEVGADLLVKNLDFAESDVLAERLEKTIPPQYLSKDKQEELQAEKTPPEPTPEEKIAQMDMKIKEMDVKEKESDNATTLAENQIKLQIEQLKLKQAEVALKTKQIEGKQKFANENAKAAGDKQNREDQVSLSNTKRKDEESKAIIDQMKETDSTSKES